MTAVTYKDIASSITGIQWRLKEQEGKDPRGVIDFTCGGKEITITEPLNVFLTDDDLSREWIAENYGFLLANTTDIPRLAA